MAVVIPFASLALVRILQWLSEREYVRVVAVSTVVFAVAALTGRPLEGRTLIRTVDWLAPYNVRYDREARAALAAHDPGRAAAAYVAFFQFEPTASQLLLPYDQGTATVMARMHVECASYFRSAGQGQQAHAQTEQARMRLRPILEGDASNLEARCLLADAAFRDESFDEAAAGYRDCIESRPYDINALTHLGVSLAASGNLSGAIDAFRRVVAIDPSNGEALRNLAIALLDHGDIAEAAQHAAEAVALEPLNPAAHDVLGRSAAAQGRLDAAAAEFEKALQIDPNYSDARQDLDRLKRSGR